MHSLFNSCSAIVFPNLIRLRDIHNVQESALSLVPFLLRHHADAAICYVFHRTGLNIITQQHISLHKFPRIPLSSSTVRQNQLNTGSQEHIFPPDNDL